MNQYVFGEDEGRRCEHETLMAGGDKDVRTRREAQSSMTDPTDPPFETRKACTKTTFLPLSMHDEQN